MTKTKGRNSVINYGICTNTTGKEDGTPCSKCQKKEIQAIRSTKEFVCEECGERLMKTDPKPPFPTWAKNIIAVVALAGLVTGGFFLFGKSEPISIVLDKEKAELKVGEVDTLQVKVEPDNAKLVISWISDNKAVVMVTSDGIVTAKSEGSANVIVVVKTENEEVRDTCMYTVTPALKENPEEVTPPIPNSQPTPGSLPKPTKTPSKRDLDLGYAKYEGDVSKGKMHGNGTLFFNKRALIPGTSVYAEGGEKIIGSFRNGKLNCGTLYRKSGNTVVVREGQ